VQVGATGRNSFISLSRDLQERALAILLKAEETKELNVALRAIREARGNLELLAKRLTNSTNVRRRKRCFEGIELVALLSRDGFYVGRRT
jgi:hypothetical protein